MVKIKLFGKQADEVAKSLEDIGKMDKCRVEAVEVDVRMKINCRSADGRPVMELSFDLPKKGKRQLEDDGGL